jgi:hypothetical protein
VIRTRLMNILEVMGLISITAGVVRWSVSVGLIVAGILLVIWSNFNAAEKPDKTE